MALQVPLTPELILLDCWDGVPITGFSRELISLLLLAAECIWARYWKESKIPTVKEWIGKVWDILIADKLSKSLLETQIPAYTSRFTERWFHFLGYIELHRYISDWRLRKLKCIALY